MQTTKKSTTTKPSLSQQKTAQKVSKDPKAQKANKEQQQQQEQEIQESYFKFNQRKLFYILKNTVKEISSENQKQILKSLFFNYLPKKLIIKEKNPSKKQDQAQNLYNDIENLAFSPYEDYLLVQNLDITFLHKLERKQNRTLIETMDILVNQFKGFQNVKFLNLDLSQNQIEAGGQQLGQMLSNFINVEEMNLIIDDNDLGKVGAEGIASGLKECKKVKNLNIKLCWNEIGPGSIQLIGEALADMENLENLNLNLQQNKIKAKGLENFSSQLGKLSNLKILNLNLMQNDISTEGIEFLADALTKLEQIENLKINLTSNTDLTSDEKDLLKGCCKHLRPKYNVIYV